MNAAQQSYRWVVTGAGGQFGSVVLRTLVEAGEAALGLISPTGPEPVVGDATRIDLVDPAAVTRLLERVQPRMIVHAAALADASAAYAEPDRARRVNVDATAHLAALARRTGARLAFISTDLAFDGREAPYQEDAAPTPLSVYARTKVEAEASVAGWDNGVVLRTAIMYGIPAVRRATVFLEQLDAIARGQPIALFEDQFRTPIALIDAARACIQAAQHSITGIVHIAGPERLSRYAMGCIMADALGTPRDAVSPNRQSEFEFSEPRPNDVSLACPRFIAAFGREPGRRMSVAMREIVREHRP